MGRMDSIVLLGVRGSVPVSGQAFLCYGGDTTCILVRMGGEVILLDCGTGLGLAASWLTQHEPLTFLLSHPHIDHLLGLPLCSMLFNETASIHIRAASRGGLSVREQAASFLSPPLWPVGPESFRADVIWEDIAAPVFSIGPVQVETMEGNHPGGVSLFRLSHQGTSLVYATDCEITEDFLPALADFARNCDLLLCDGQYTDSEYSARKGWGHSSWSMAAALSDRCGARRTVLIHHAPDHSDDILDEGAQWLQSHHPSCHMGKTGEELFL